MRYLATIVFSFLVSFGYLAFSETVLSRGDIDINKRTQYLFDLLDSNDTKPSVIILGSSNALCSLDPYYLDGNYKFLNAALDGASVNYLVSFYSSKVDKPGRDIKFLIFAVHPTSFSSSLVRSDVDDQRYERYKGFASSIAPVKFLTHLHIWNRRSILESSASVFSRSLAYKSNFPRKRVDINSYANSFTSCYYNSGSTSEFVAADLKKPDAQQVSDLLDFFHRVSASGVSPVLLVTPYPKNSFTAQSLVPFQETLNDFKSNGYLVIDYDPDDVSSDFNLSSDYFHDTSHLTDSGAKKYSSALKSFLNSLY